MMKRFHFFSISTMVGILLFAFYFFSHKKPFSPKPNTALQSLGQEENELWQELAQFSITRDHFNKERERYQQEYNKKFKPINTNTSGISSNTQNLIHDILDEFNIDKLLIKIVPYVDPAGYSPAAANDYCLFIDDQTLKNYSGKAQKFIIGHEIQHIRFQDDSTDFIMKKIYPEHKRTKKDLIVFNKFRRFQEKRADLYAISQHPDYAHGEIEFMGSFLQKYGDTKGISHPKISDRLKLAHSVLQVHNNVALA